MLGGSSPVNFFFGLDSIFLKENDNEVTLCFSRIPHFSLPSSCPRSRCCRLWTALRKDDILCGMKGIENGGIDYNIVAIDGNILPLFNKLSRVVRTKSFSSNGVVDVF